MKRIVLTTLNARYIHSSIGLRYLYANLGEMRGDAKILEFTVGDRPADLAEKILEEEPQIVGIGVAIWNARECGELVRVLKAVRPELVVVLGGPEVSHEPLRVDFSPADYMVTGEGELAFSALCRKLLSGVSPPDRVIRAPVPDLSGLKLPYEWYSEEDVAHRVIYLEASRGCPFGCEFCLSSIDRRVRFFETGRILEAIDRLWNRGVRHFKFIDRSFNIDFRTAFPVLDYFLEKEAPYMVHFEMVPSILPPGLRERLSRFPAGTVQLEVGIQTLNPEVASRIGRPLDPDGIGENLAFLSRETTVHLHLDLIFGLPGESLESMASGLDRLMAMGTGEIQLGILKKLSGTAIARHDGPFAMVFSPLPPYELLSSGVLPFGLVQELKRMARYWDLCYNSGRFRALMPLFWPDGRVFDSFFHFSQWLYRQLGSTGGISLDRLTEAVKRYLTDVRNVDSKLVHTTLEADRGTPSLNLKPGDGNKLPRRQSRHRR